MNKFGLFAFLSILVMGSTGQTEVATAPTFYKVHPETANLVIERTDYSVKSGSSSMPLITRSFRRLEKELGIFGQSWCSNVDLSLSGVEGRQPKIIELHDCLRPRNRVFRKVLETWVEDGSGTRILRKADGRFELSEAPHPIFRPDGKLDSFVAEDHGRWFLRRDSAGSIESLDNLKSRPIKFRRNSAGDLEALLDGSGKVVAKYRFASMLESVQIANTTESYEYDAAGNVLKLLRQTPGVNSQLWRFSYTTTEWVSTVQQPDGCISRWIFDRSQVSADGAAIAKETKTCQAETLGVSKPVVAVTPVIRKLASAPKAIVPNGSDGLGGKPSTVLLRKPGPLGVGDEQAYVTLNREGLPILFEIAQPGGKVRRLEIDREDISGSTHVIRSTGVEVNFRKKPKTYETRQLDLLDDYEAWMSAWGSR